MIQLARKRFTVAEFEQMAETGVLLEDARLELLQGEIVAMNPIGVRHAGTVNALNDELALGLGTAALVSVQNPVALDEQSELYPDVAVLQRRPDRYRTGRPRPRDVLLLVEVSDTTLAYDRDVKMPLYGGAGIIEAWLVDLVHEVVLVYTDPSPEGYAMVRTLRRGDSLCPVAFPDLQLAVTEILG